MVLLFALEEREREVTKKSTPGVKNVQAPNRPKVAHLLRPQPMAVDEKQLLDLLRTITLQVHHLSTTLPQAAFPRAPPLLTLQECLTEEGKRKDRRHSSDLLREIHSLEKSMHKLVEAIDAAPIPLFGDGKLMCGRLLRSLLSCVHPCTRTSASSTIKRTPMATCSGAQGAS
jgi:hypothetical protein